MYETYMFSYPSLAVNPGCHRKSFSPTSFKHLPHKMHFFSFLAAASTIGLAFAAPSKHAKRAGKMQWVGVNESGPEFGDHIFPGLYGKDYIWPTLSTYDTFIARGFNTFRINIYMERLIPTLSGSPDPAYLGNLTEQVNYVTSKGAYAMIQPHNYGRCVVLLATWQCFH